MQSRQGYSTTGGFSTSTPSVQGYTTTSGSAQTTTYARSYPAPQPPIYSTPSMQGYASTPGYTSQTFFSQPRVVVPGTTVIRTYNPGCCSGC